MAAEGTSPTVRRRRLGIELRRLRETAGLTGDEVAERLEWSTTKVSRIETGRVGVHPNDVRYLLDLYGVTDEDDREALVRIARESRRPGWWHSYADVLPAWFEVYVGLEAAADSVWTYQGQLVPGLLQTKDYARAAFEAVGPFGAPDDIERSLDLRMQRQQLLTKEDPLKLWAVLDESVLRRPVGGEVVMRTQLQRLRQVAELANVILQVLPLRAGAHAAMDWPFSILKFSEGDPDVAYVDTLTGAIYADREADVARYRLVFDHLRALSLSPRESIALIAQIEKEGL